MLDMCATVSSAWPFRRCRPFVGDDVVRAEVINDRGVHICKSMLAWQRWGGGATPATTGQKGDHFVGDYYVRFAQEAAKDPSLADAAQEMLKKWEDSDAEVRALWRMMNTWVEEGFRETFAQYGFVFDREYYESEVYQRGKDIVEEGVARGVLVREDSGAVVFPLDATVLVYRKMVAQKRRHCYVPTAQRCMRHKTLRLPRRSRRTIRGLDASVFVVGEEQEYHFQTMFALFRAMGFSWATQCYHLSYALW